MSESAPSDSSSLERESVSSSSSSSSYGTQYYIDFSKWKQVSVMNSHKTRTVRRLVLFDKDCAAGHNFHGVYSQ